VSIRARIFVIFIACVAGGFGWVIYWLSGDLKQRYEESFEEVLVDSVNLLAEQLSLDWEKPADERLALLRASMARLDKRGLLAKINNFEKVTADIRVYVTDADGRLMYHSAPGHSAGEDFSKWLDVSRTLKGNYGARTSDEMIPDASGQPQVVSVAYVAAPVYSGSRFVAVVSLGKPKTNIRRFLLSAQRQLRNVVVATAALALALAALLYLWVSRPMQALADYAHSVSVGERAILPDLGDNEVGRVGAAMESMRLALEDKHYVENYVQTLTHELKSPLTGIRASAELLGGELSDAQRRSFAASIERESTRLGDITERMLRLATLERTRQLAHTESVALFVTTAELAEGAQRDGAARGVRVSTELVGNDLVTGDPFLLRQAIDNLLRNALEFSPDAGRIEIRGASTVGAVSIEIQDSGPGIPDYARERIFERFYSLPRPHSGRKSTGLGLNFVREVAQLHGGRIEIQSPPPGAEHGTLAQLTIPKQLIRR
jgi:two-component system sensor histidine kinase CreC